MTDIDIAELVKKYRYDSDGLLAALEAMLPKPTCPEHMLGLWAQHPEHGRVLVTYDRPDEDGDVIVAVRMAEHRGGIAKKAVNVSELTFPHQVTKGELPTETEEEYEALPEGSIVGDYLAPSKRKTETLWQKMPSGHWWRVGMDYSANLAGERRRVLRRGWGNG